MRSALRSLVFLLYPKSVSLNGPRNGSNIQARPQCVRMLAFTWIELSISRRVSLRRCNSRVLMPSFIHLLSRWRPMISVRRQLHFPLMLTASCYTISKDSDGKFYIYIYIYISISLSSFLTRRNSIVNLAPLEFHRLSSSDVNISSSVDEKQRQPTLENIYYIWEYPAFESFLEENENLNLFARAHFRMKILSCISKPLAIPFGNKNRWNSSEKSFGAHWRF